MMNILSSKLWTCFNECQMLMCTWSKKPNYYDVLKISRKSTQDDIKTAYYKLSKQYHPDKNKSSEAKETFQKVSDAYEILGNFEKRKQYDRQLNIKAPFIVGTEQPFHNDDYELGRFHRSRKSNVDPKTFDVDEWYRAHYSEAFMDYKNKKYQRYMRQKNFEQENANVKPTPTSFIFYQLIFMFVLISLSLKGLEDYDRVNVKRKGTNS